MRVGFTGTQNGMTEAQKAALTAALKVLPDVVLHHGDCVGADAQAHAIAKSLGMRVTLHPPLKETKRAYCHADVVCPAKDYRERNHDIVMVSEVLFATPKSFKEEFRGSGTWMTIRMARMAGIPLVIIYPDGRTS